MEYVKQTPVEKVLSELDISKADNFGQAAKMIAEYLKGGKNHSSVTVASSIIPYMYSQLKLAIVKRSQNELHGIYQFSDIDDVEPTERDYCVYFTFSLI